MSWGAPAEARGANSRVFDKMKLTKTSTQAALALVYLSERRDEGPTQARQVAEHLKVPTDSALKVLQALVRHDLLRSQLGRSGGYRLQRDPATVTLLQIIEAIDGPVRVELPAHVHGQDQWTGPAQVLGEVCQCVTSQTRQQLQRITVVQLARES